MLSVLYRILFFPPPILAVINAFLNDFKTSLAMTFSPAHRFIQSYMGDRPLTPVVPGLGNGNASSKPDPNSVKDDKLDLDLIR